MATQVLVVGGGYAGVIAANRLMSEDDIEVTLVNPRPHFVERIRLHQRLTGSARAVVDYADVLNPRIRIVVDAVDRIDPPTRSVTTRAGATIGYDYLVYAVGSSSATPTVPGAAEHALAISSLEDTDRLRDALTAAPDDADVIVVGAGPTGIEVAGELAESGRRVTLVSGGPLNPYLSEAGRRRATSALTDLGVTVLDGTGSRVTSVDDGAVTLADGGTIAGDLIIWTAGFAVPDLARRSGLSTDDAGRLLTDETLVCVDDDRILAAGDAADPSGMPMRMSCQAAIPLGAQAARTILSLIDGATPRPIDSGFVAQCLSIGRSRGVFQPAHSDDSALRLAVGGRAGAYVKELVARSVTSALAKESRHPGSFRWPSVKVRERALAERATTTLGADVGEAA